MRIDKLLDILAWVFLFTGIILLMIGGRIIDNIIHANNFTIKSLAVGAIFAGVFIYVLLKLIPNYFKGGNSRASAILSFIFGIIVITLFGAGKFNMETSNNKRIVTGYVVKKTKNHKYGTPYLKILVDGRIERFQPLKEEWDLLFEKDSLYLTVGKGDLGYDYIFKFSKK